MKSEIESLRKWQRLASLMSDDNGEDACRGCNYRCDYRGFGALKNRVKRRCLALRKNIERNIEAIKMCIGTAVDAFVKK